MGFFSPSITLILHVEVDRKKLKVDHWELKKKVWLEQRVNSLALKNELTIKGSTALAPLQRKTHLYILFFQNNPVHIDSM